MKGLFDTAARGFGTYSDIAWFFKDGQYIRYIVSTDTVDLPAPRATTSEWAQNGSIRWPWNSVDATLNGCGDYAGKIWFFRGGDYFRYDLADDSIDFAPKSIAASWAQNGSTRWPFSSVDCAIHGVGQYDGKAWFFKGSKYFRLDIATDTIDVAPTDIASAWGQGKWPLTFATGVDCAIYGTGDLANQIYFFRGDQYIRYNPDTDTIERGPLPIKGNWGTLFEQLYDATTVWGVDSVNPASHMLGTQSHYDFVVDHMGVQPHYYGRYLSMLTPAEVTFLAARQCKILPIKNGLDNVFGGGLREGVKAATDAASTATTLGITAGVVLYADIEPGWAPTRDFLLGWMLGISASKYQDGIYMNPQATSPFLKPYADAFAVRDTIAAAVSAGADFSSAANDAIKGYAAVAADFPALASLTAFKPSRLWSGYPQVPNMMDFSGCPTAPEAMRRTYAPILAPTNGAATVVWQFKINCLPFPATPDIHSALPVIGGKQAIGQIDNDLATLEGFANMWDPSAPDSDG